MNSDNAVPPNLPRRVRLEELVIAFTGSWGSDNPSADTQEFLALGVGNVTNDGELNLDGAKTRHFKREEMGGVAEEGDLLVVKSSGSAANIRSGKTAICPPELSRKISCSNFMMRLKVKRDVADPYLLWLILNSQAAKTFIRKIVGASTYPNIKWENYRRFEFELPPLEEQRRIAARLREQLSILTEARSAIEGQLTAAESLHTAHLRAVFESEKMQRWPLRRLGDLLVLRQDIVHPRNKPRGPARFVGLEHIESRTGQRIGELPVQMEQMTGRKARFLTGDIVYGYLRPYLNKVWIAEFDGLCSVDQYVFEVRRDVAETNFVAWFMRSSTYLSRAPVKETPGWLPRIRTDEVAAVEINLPPVEVQRSIGDKLNMEFAETGALQRTVKTKLSELEKLPPALLRSAFNPKGD
jgi:restriction endonuclease S subunit